MNMDSSCKIENDFDRKWGEYEANGVNSYSFGAIGEILYF